MTRVLVTGAGGGVGRHLVPALSGHYEVTATDLVEAPGIVALDVLDVASLARSLDGIDVVVHLAGQANPRSSWAELAGPNVDAIPALLDAVVGAGVSRVVLASSLHAVGGHLDAGARLVEGGVPALPCCPYGATKVLAEALGSAYTELWDLSVICLRLGGVAPAPLGRSWLSGWLSPADLARLYRAAIETDVGYGVFPGTSANTASAWDLGTARDALGYDPRDDSATFVDVADDLGDAPREPPRWGLLHRS